MERGRGLWNSVVGTMVLELPFFVGALAIYIRSTRWRDRIGTWALLAFVALNGLVYLAGPFGSPPPDPGPVAWVGLAGFLLPAWTWWIDRHPFS